MYKRQDSKRELDHEREKHWGFFTWFILMFVAPSSFGWWESDMLTCLIVPSFPQRLISSLDPGSTTTDTELVDGIFFPTATRFEISHIFSKIG